MADLDKVGNWEKIRIPFSSLKGCIFFSHLLYLLHLIRMSRVAVDTSSISPEQLQTCYQLKRNVAHIVEVRLIAMERLPCDHPGPLKILPSLQQHAHLKVFVASQGFHHNGSIEHTYVR